MDCPEYGVARFDLCVSLKTQGNPGKEDIREVLGRLEQEYMKLACDFIKQALIII